MSIKQGGNTIAGSVGVYPLNERNVSNCITEIPQDIKLELNNGTLTLKAGSKVYVPNGAGVFDEITTSSDLTWTGGFGSTQFFVYVSPNNNLGIREVSLTESGSSSALTSQYRCWYDTTNNRVKWTDDYGSSWTEGFSFPVALVTTDASSIISIDKIFNGFGYIGSTVFALPGVKGLIPNGRNADGSLKNTECLLTGVATYTLPNTVTGSGYPITIYNEGIVYWGNTYTYFGGPRPTNPLNWTRWYNEADNLWEYYNNGWGVEPECVIGFANVSSGKITALYTKPVFRGVDFGDTEFIAQQALPSNIYVDVTPGASGTIYTFGANGLLCIGFQHPDDSNWVNYGVDILDANENFIWNIQGTRMLNNQTDGVAVPVNKNQKVRIYNNSYVINRLRFVYAVGEL